MASTSKITKTGNEGRGVKYINYIPIPRRILDYAVIRQMYVVQVNAQRFFGPSVYVTPGWEPDQGSEIFVGKIPRYYLEPELLPFLEQVGPVFQLRLMMNFSGSNKGYCFVKYFHPEQANLAVSVLHRALIRRGCYVVASNSVDNRKLILRGVPTVMSVEEVLVEAKRIFEGVASVQLSWMSPVKQPNGIVYVTYESHRAAAMARKKLLSNKVQIRGFQIRGDWAMPDLPCHFNRKKY